MWIHAFLTGRLQTVSVGGSQSQKAQVISGVPQGSVLGPLLFLIYMGDINEGVNGSNLSSFADDTSLSLPITSTEDVPNPQRDLNTVYAWASRNNMVFNEEKFEILRHGQHQEIKTETNLLTEGGHGISTLQTAKCLGIWEETAPFTNT
ncbi:uncharacterized protein LOC143030226 [Oratosquilla oratoria]|uniref:uncharacterized protein LOC143030226 n=1 Tax=Oratosquilla oratoria TaxID=337810 RepID=UPI003F75DDEE